jgi:hypothetical protein
MSLKMDFHFHDPTPDNVLTVGPVDSGVFEISSVVFYSLKHGTGECH